MKCYLFNWRLNNRGLNVAQMMDKKSKILLATFLVLLVLSVGASFYRYIIARDYIIEAQVECDPTMESCFISTEDQSAYKLIHKKAKDIPLCDPQQQGCDALTCEPGQANCQIITCDESLAQSYSSVCSHPNWPQEKSETDLEDEPELEVD